jgi:hypothetical protein
MLAHFQHLKSQMNKMRDGERDKLTKLTLESNSAIKEIKRRIEKVSIHLIFHDQMKSRVHFGILNFKYCKHL